MSFNVFSDMSVIEPRCPSCEAKLEYGENTTYSDEHEAHVCNACKAVLK